MSNNLPLLAITIGDPAGIGPEVVLKALRHADVYARCRPLVLGDRRILERAAPWVGATDLGYELVEDPAGGHYRDGTVTLLDMANAAPDACPIGQISAEAGRAAVVRGAGHRRAADRGGWAEPARRRGRPVRRPGSARNRAGDHGGARARLGCIRPAAARHGVPARYQRRLRHCGGDVPRSGSRP